MTDPIAPFSPPELPARPSTAADASPTFLRKWWVYQGERFPLIGHGILIAAFSFCAVSLSRALRGAAGYPNLPQLAVAFVTCFIYFLQLRIADEFKDFEEDSRYRPYRPVPRGLISLRELAGLFALGAAVQLLAALWLNWRGLILLAITWSYLAAMSKEFFVGDWLRRRHLLYMFSHMVILPLVDLYATSTDWLATPTARPPRGLLFFLLASYCNGLVIELGRKIRSPHDEETGVATYSKLLGPAKALAGWWVAMIAAMAFALLAADRLHLAGAVGAMQAAVVIGAIVVGVMFLRQMSPGRGKWIERYSGIWTIALYLSLGLSPHFLSKGA